MGNDEKAPRPEREQTDESLRTERARTDEELAVRLKGIEEDAAGAVERARESADDMLAASRAEADRGLSGSAPPSSALVGLERAQDDEARARERAVADEALHRAREDQLRSLLRLLPLEREKTDLYLLTERARSDEALSNRDDFLGIVSHDLRNLLSTVVSGAQLILEHDASGKGEPDSIAPLAQRIRRAATRMTRLIEDLVDVSSLEAGKLGIVRVDGDATALILEALEAFRPSAAAKGISLEPADVAPSLPATFDHDRILQVLANLIGNAIKFTPPGGQIRVGAARVGAEVRLSVQDTGPGIPAAQVEAVFERFWQVGVNDRRGLGLGLYIARGIVEAHGGTIWAESALGEGSTFYFTLGAAPPAVHTSSNSASSAM
jgi:signal transduction histidine kinase